MNTSSFSTQKKHSLTQRSFRLSQDDTLVYNTPCNSFNINALTQMEIHLYDTLSRTKKRLQSDANKPFSLYCCGPTVYGPAHVGNFRTFLLQDVFRRVLELGNFKPLYVRNITDVDDKTIRQSQAESTSLKEFTEKWTRVFHEDCTALNMLPPHKEPKATEHIQQQINLIQTLIDKGHAYTSQEGSVYFKISSFKDYGKLAHLDTCMLQTQEDSPANINADEYDRESVSDFALWKAHKDDDGPNYWESPWGKGRPGWHIECSAMSREYLGDTFDLHGGGIDLIFPHHENEIAQSEAVTGKPFSHSWFHCAHLKVDGQKMSKSLGNFYRLSDIKEKGFSPMTLRYTLIMAHYRQTLNLNDDSLHAAQSALSKLEKLARYLTEKANNSIDAFKELQSKPIDEGTQWGPFEEVWSRICDDLNTPAALGALFTAAKHLEHQDLIQSEAEDALKELTKALYIFGIKLFTDEKKAVEVPENIQTLAQNRWNAKQNKDFAEADTLRNELKNLGWNVLDKKDGFELTPL